MQCREVELILEQEGLPPVPEAARAHIADCGSCRALVEDLTGIVAAAHLLPAEIEPPAHIWTSLRAQLEAEGLIKRPFREVEHASWWESFARIFTPRGLATATVGLLIIAAAGMQVWRGSAPQPEPQAQNQTAVAVRQVPFSDIASTLDQEEQTLANMHLASTSPVDASMQENLQTLNSFIRDCRRRVEQDPQDELAREYLSGAYQQKAELLAAMMDRGGSVN